jgi:hypothetical protein
MKYFLAGVTSILVLLLAVVGGFYLGMKRIAPSPTVTPTPLSTPTLRLPIPTVVPASVSPTPASIPQPSSTPTIVPTPTLTSTPTPTPTPDDSVAIKSALADKLGVAEDSLDVSVSENTGTHAKGGVREIGVEGGAYWIAAKVGDQWVIVYDGHANPTCAEIAPYDFPSSMVPECYAADGSVVTR